MGRRSSHHYPCIGWGYDRALGVAAWQVQSVNGITTKTGVPHITAMMENKSVKPFLAAKIKNWRKLAEPFTVHGTFAEVFPKNVHVDELEHI